MDRFVIILTLTLAAPLAAPLAAAPLAPAQELSLSPGEKERYDEVLAADVHGLRSLEGMARDEAAAFLEIPERYRQNPDFTLAAAPPVVHFSIMRGYEPEFFPAGQDEGLWSIWGQSVYAPQTGCFYTGVGDHRVRRANCFLVEFNPSTRTHRVVLDVNAFLGRAYDMTRDGKIHGWLRVDDQGDLYFATYNARWPRMLEEDFESGYDGGHLVRYNVVTGEAEDLGCPLLRRSWPFHNMDVQRGLFYGVGLESEFLAYDLNERRMLFGGYCPPGMSWENRCLLVDEPTGRVYSTNLRASKLNAGFVEFDPATGQFRSLNSKAPDYPLSREGVEIQPRVNDNVRCHTDRRSADGSYYCMTYSGSLFKFWPDEDRVEFLTMNWDNGRYCASVTLSSSGRYLYYSPGSHGEASLDQVPIVQYDTRTGQKKVLAFLGPHYREKYNYTLGGTFSIHLLPGDDTLFIAWNGRFETDMRGGYDGFGHPSYMLLEIPEGERAE